MLLVTGITGHTGRYFLQELITNQYQDLIRCVVRETSDTSPLDSSGLNIEKAVGDLNDISFLRQAIEGVDTIMHIYNIYHSPIIVEAAIEERVKRIVLVHTTGVYSKFKHASEDYRKVENKVIELMKNPDCPTKITILRPTMIYGDLCDKNMSIFIKIIDKLRIVPVVNGGQSFIQPVNARDLGKAYYAVLMSSDQTVGKMYDLSGEAPLKIIDAFRLISKKLNKKTLFINVPISIGVILAKTLKFATLGRVDFIEKVQRLDEDRSYQHFEAEHDFGFNPMSFEKGIHMEIEQYMSK